MDALAVLMQDLLTQNHALRRENDELMDQVRRLLCEKANLLAQVWPPACPVAFPETFKAMHPLAGNLKLNGPPRIMPLPPNNSEDCC